MAQTLDGPRARAWIAAFLAAFARQREELDDLDRRAGDGDFGSNLLAALEPAATRLADSSEDGAGPAFADLSMAFMSAGGTSGPLFGVWFREFAKAAGEDGLDPGAIADAATAGLEAVSRLGGAASGERTMVDAMAPAAAALAAAAAAGATLRTALAAAAAAAFEGVAATAEMVPRRGRASYVGESARGVRDPGALAVALFFDAGGDALAAET